MSESTGEIRTGRDDSHSWTIVADESGWPIFVHTETGQRAYCIPRPNCASSFRVGFLFSGEISSYDPRFEDEQTELKFEVLHEMRQVAYLCQDLLDRHQAAKPTELRNILREISRSHLRKRL